MAIQSSDYLAVYQITSGEVRKATVGALLAQGGAGILWKEDGNAVTPKATGADLKIEGFIQTGNDPTTGLAGVSMNQIGQIHATESGAGKVFTGRQTGSSVPTSTIQGDGTATFIQLNSTSVNAGNGDNEITLDGSNGEITGGANAFIDGGTYS